MNKQFNDFLKHEATAGILILAMLIVALIIVHTPLNSLYQYFIHLPLGVKVGQSSLVKPLLLWVNDGLMAIFFMLLSLEVKREIIEDNLSSIAKVALPFFAAIGGIVFPILFFIFFNYHSTSTIKGWPIPTTTDIAFALTIVTLLGQRIPPALKAFLVALSIIDDVLAITIIAVFYSSNLTYTTIILALILIAVLILMNIFSVKKTTAYLIIGFALWVIILKSGIHATLAGVIVGLCIPIKVKHSDDSPLKTLEHKIHPFVAFFVLPFFVFVNGGVSFANFSLGQLTESLALGIITGLVLGKMLGGFIFSWIIIKLKFSKLPDACNWLHILGICALTGIGFTMSLFISSLAFTNTPYEMLARQAILIASLISAIIGIIILCSIKPKKE